MSWCPEFTHRDGLVLAPCNIVRTSIAWKCNRRGVTANLNVFVGTADSDPFRTGERRSYVVLALHNDVHHAVMTPEEADELAERLIQYAATVRGGPR